jgi:hypothetical protein
MARVAEAGSEPLATHTMNAMNLTARRPMSDGHSRMRQNDSGRANEAEGKGSALHPPSRQQGRVWPSFKLLRALQLKNEWVGPAKKYFTISRH